MAKNTPTKKKDLTLKKQINGYIDDKFLSDPPARLFRALLNKLKINPLSWANYLKEHLEHTVVMEDKEKERRSRTHQISNYKTAFFNSKTLTFNKLLEGLSILQIKECEIVLKVKTMDDKEIIVSEKSLIKNCKNSSKAIKKEGDK